MNKMKLMLLTGLMLVLVFSLSGSVLAAEKGHTGGLGEQRIDFNLASAENLAKAPGMTPELGKAIVDYREANGPYRQPEDLKKVPGITDEIYKQLNPVLGPEHDLYCVPRPGEELEEEEMPALAPSKC